MRSFLGRLKEPAKLCVSRFFDTGSREAPEGPPWAFPRPLGASRRPPGPETNQSKRPRNLKEFLKQWRREVSIKPDFWGPSGLLPSEIHQLRWGGEAPQLQFAGFSGGRRPFGPPRNEC
jgi:hypothetical protein